MPVLLVCTYTDMLRYYVVSPPSINGEKRYVQLTHTKKGKCQEDKRVTYKRLHRLDSRSHPCHCNKNGCLTHEEDGGGGNVSAQTGELQTEAVRLITSDFDLACSGSGCVFFTITMSDSAANQNRRVPPTLPVAPSPASVLSTIQANSRLVCFCQNKLRPS